MAQAGCPLCGTRVSWPTVICHRCLAGKSLAEVRATLGQPPATPDPAPELPKREPSPHVKGKVLGFRAWSLDGYQLTSVAIQSSAWKIGANEATCRRSAVGLPFFPPGYLQSLGLPEPEPTPPPERHEAPQHGCECGLYAYHAPFWSMAPEGDGVSVYGAVLAWGRVQVHHDGFRAQYAEPVVLAYSRRQVYEHVNAIKAIAGEMNVPCVELDELAARAVEFGATVEQELRPEAPPAYQSFPVGPFASGGLMLPPGSSFTIAFPPPPKRKPIPKRAYRFPMVLSATLAAAYVALGFIDGNSIWFALTAIWVISFGLHARSYRRLKRLASA